MIKSLGFIVLWLTGSATAVAVAWAGVSAVNDDLVNPAPAINLIETVTSTTTGPADTGQANEVAGGPTSVTSSPDSTAAPSASSANQSSSSPSTTSSKSPSSSNADSSSVSTTTQSAVTSTTSPSSTTSTSTSSTSTTSPTTSTTTSAPAQTLTFNLTGGSTAVSFSANGVQVLWATPNPGFDVKIEPESPGFKVEFRSDSHRSRVDVWWSGGSQHSIREEPK